METKNTLPYLSHELIIQILLRLPVKSLIRFKCVCKSWLSLISDPHFTNSHFQTTAETHSRRIMFISYSPPLQTRFIDYEPSIHQHTASASLNLNFTPFESYPHIQIIGSCRGFILFDCYCKQIHDYIIYIWNPSTGFHKKLPLSPFSFSYDSYAQNFSGFGYDRLTDDYLLVSLCLDQNMPNISPHLVFFSFRDNTWKEIKGTHFPYENFSYVDPQVGSLYNEAIHWLAFHHDLQTYVIVAFDLMERKLLDMHLPVNFDREIHNCGLWVFGEFLSLWAMDIDNDTVEIWVMKEYKMHSSWTKTLVLPTNGLPVKYFIPLCTAKSGDIIGTDGGTGWAKYNDKGHLLDHSDYNDSHGFQAEMYIESLLSLPADNEQA
ncbi:F-box/kelch-repeat protein At3g23880-like [Trifolium pratense]|uniref:F-box/kelch-repeat protein At3g23880-like n=1 Tax=Trifolium pratense TaxID=57577 RepID=UPI001E69141F|nr:F-box/kelch-repeat protein At3g23880-like [Trifolium pratense]